MHKSVQVHLIDSLASCRVSLSYIWYSSGIYNFSPNRVSARNYS